MNELYDKEIYAILGKVKLDFNEQYERHNVQ